MTINDIVTFFSKHTDHIPYALPFNTESDLSVVMFGGVHGNETAGIEVMYDLYTRRGIMHGGILAVLGNPEAIRNNVRYIDEDLNRKFTDRITGETVEAKRAREIEQLLIGLSRAGHRPLVIDMHTMSTGKFPVMIAEKDDEEAIRTAEHTTLCGSLVLFRDTGIGVLGELARRCGLPYLTVELGQHTDPASVRRGLLFMEEALAYLHILKGKTLKRHRKEFYEITQPIPVTPGFRFTKKNLKSISLVEQGEVYARDDTGGIIAEYDGAILFPSRTPDRRDADAGFLCLPVGR